MKKVKDKFIQIDISKLKLHPKNPKLHNVDLIKGSINRSGYLAKIIVDENNVILGGHGRLKALKALGVKDIMVNKVTGLSEKEKEEYLLTDNKSTIEGGFSDELLKLFDKNLLADSGWDKLELANIFGDKPTDDDWADAFKETVPKELKGLKQITFILKETQIIQIKKILKKHDVDINKALYKIIIDYDNTASNQTTSV